MTLSGTASTTVDTTRYYEIQRATTGYYKTLQGTTSAVMRKHEWYYESLRGAAIHCERSCKTLKVVP